MRFCLRLHSCPMIRQQHALLTADVTIFGVGQSCITEQGSASRERQRYDPKTSEWLWLCYNAQANQTITL